MRAADADARGSMTNIAVTMNTANRICIAYCSDENIAPTCITPASMRWLPTQMIATLVKLSIRISAGMSTAIRRFTAIAVLVRSRFAASNRSRCRAPRSNARMTRTPLSPSPSTRLSRSILSCMAVDSGTAPRMISANTTAITGITAISTQASCASCDSARMTPPIAIIGAAITMVSIMMIICCTWVVSLVVRVTSEADAEPLELVDRQALGAREDGAAQDPRRTRSPPSPSRSCRRWRTSVATSDISSIRPPTSRIARWSPVTMPWSTMSDVSRGSSRLPSDWARASTSTSASSRRWGARKRESFSMGDSKYYSGRHSFWNEWSRAEPYVAGVILRCPLEGTTRTMIGAIVRLARLSVPASRSRSLRPPCSASAAWMPTPRRNARRDRSLATGARPALCRTIRPTA